MNLLLPEHAGLYHQIDLASNFSYRKIKKIWHLINFDSCSLPLGRLLLLFNLFTSAANYKSGYWGNKIKQCIISTGLSINYSFYYNRYDKKVKKYTMIQFCCLVFGFIQKISMQDLSTVYASYLSLLYTARFSGRGYVSFFLAYQSDSLTRF